MWNKFIQWILSADDRHRDHHSHEVWCVPEDGKLSTLEVFVSTGLQIGRGVYPIDFNTDTVQVGDVVNSHFNFQDRLPKWYAGDGVAMRSKDYSCTACVYTCIPLERTTSSIIDDTATDTPIWIFNANDLYWEHHKHGLVPFLTISTSEGSHGKRKIYNNTTRAR